METELSLLHQYHDSVIAGIAYSKDRNVTFTVNLDGCWNDTPNNPVELTFFGVRNITEVKKALHRAAASSKDKDYVDEICCICCDPPKGIRIDLVGYGPLYIDADSYVDT